MTLYRRIHSPEGVYWRGDGSRHARLRGRPALCLCHENWNWRVKRVVVARMLGTRILGGFARLRGAAVGACVAPASPFLQLARSMSLWKSNAVKQWVGDQAIAKPTQWRPFRWNGRWRTPELSKREQALLVKEAIRRGEISLEPTLMVPPPKFKGHKRERMRPVALESISAKMLEMPKLIAEYRLAARERRRKLKADNRWK